MVSWRQVFDADFVALVAGMQSEAYARLQACELYLGWLKLDVPWQAQHGSHPNWAAPVLGRRVASAISTAVFSLQLLCGIVCQ